jgi:hypothetical protein
MNCQGKTPWTINIYFKNEDRKVKQALSGNGYQWEGGKTEGKGEWGQIYRCILYENRIMKPVEIVLRKGRGNEGERWGGGESN